MQVTKTISVLKRKSGGVTRDARCVTVTLSTRSSCVTHGLQDNRPAYVV